MVAGLLRPLIVATVVSTALTTGPDLIAPREGEGRRPIAAAASDRRGQTWRREERQYRVNGKVRMLLFWVGRDDVGGARIRWESSPGGSSFALLAGSNPDRAPNRLNQWVYLREETLADDARVFVLRSLTDAESAISPHVAVLDGPQFGASCASLTAAAVRTAATTVTVTQGLTYDRFGWVLEQIADSPGWTAQSSDRPPGAEAGFLTALERLIDGPQPAPGRSIAYIYNHIAYDLTVVRVEWTGPRTIGGREYAQLVGADVALRNRITRNVTRFSVTFDPDDATCPVRLPVQIVYQPNWWLKIELNVDETVDLPRDPAADAETLERIHRVCARATEGRAAEP